LSHLPCIHNKISKIKPGTTFAAEAQNSGHQIPKPAAVNTDTEDDALEHQASGLLLVLQKSQKGCNLNTRSQGDASLRLATAFMEQ